MAGADSDFRQSLFSAAQIGKGAVFEEEICLSDCTFSEELKVQGAQFRGGLVAESAKFTRLVFEACTFRGDVEMRNCRLSGDLVFRRCRFIRPGRRRRSGSLLLPGTRVEGNVDLSGLDLSGRPRGRPVSMADLARAGDCSIPRIVVGGDLRIHDLKAAQLDFGKARVTGEIRVSGSSPDDAGGVGEGSLLAGDVSAGGTTCQSLEWRDTRIGGDLECTGLQVAGNILLCNLHVAGGVTFLHLDCKEVVRIHGGSRFAGSTTFAGATIRAQLDLSESTFGEIVFNGTAIGSLWIGALGPVECAGIYATDSSIKTYARLSRLTVRESHAQEDGEAPPPSSRVEDFGSILFRHCRFGSLFSTWAAKRYNEEPNGWQEDNRVSCERSFLFTDCVVEGELNLTRLTVGDGSGMVGDVRLDRTRVAGALLIASPLSVSQRLDLPLAARAKAWKLVQQRTPASEAYRASMASLALRDVKAGSVDLTGLTLVAPEQPDLSSRPIAGSVIGDRLEVNGCLATYVAVSEGEDHPAFRDYAHIPGALRLRAAMIGELHLASESFSTQSGCTAWTDGVVLELAELGQLRVPPRAEGAGDHANGFPVPLDLSGMTVRNWNFDEHLHVESTVDVSKYLDFLDNDERLHREVYKSIAQSLRNAGRDEDAEDILYTEEYRARWESYPDSAGGHRSWQLGKGRRTKPLFRRLRERLPRTIRERHPLHVADRWLLQYRRNPIRLLYMIIALYAVSTAFVASHPTNFELSDRSRLILQNAGGGPYASGIDYQHSGSNIGPGTGDWTFWSAAWMAARYHIPIVSLTVQDEYTASNDARLDIDWPWAKPDWRIPGEDPGRLWFTAEDWFALMSLINWVMWPLLLTFALRRALRSE